MSRTIHYGYDDLAETAVPPPLPRRWQAWQRMLKVAPHLKSMLPYAANELQPPYPTADRAFLALAACFADPTKREALRALIFDLMYDDLKDLFIGHCERMHGWKPKQRSPRS